MPEEPEIPAGLPRFNLREAKGKREMSEPLKLANIYGAADAWNRLAALKLPAHTAYRLLKYARKAAAEREIVEQQRIRLVRQAVGAKDGESVTLKPGMPEYEAFVAEFGQLLETDADLPPFDMTLTGLLDLAAKEPGNMLSVADLAQLEPFFKEVTE